METGFTDDLDAWLDAVRDRYEVERTLKSTPSEVTEVVWRRAQDGNDAMGPFVRKTFKDFDGRGSAYVDLFRAQTRGYHLAHQPFLYECERTGDVLQVVMEYIEGENLKQLVSREGAGTGLTLKVMGEVCDAAGELHESLEGPIIHRDIKPTNIMVSDGHVTLIDLGISRVWRDGAEHDTMRLGTPGYAPPEQYGYGQTSVRSDVFALGMTCAFCLLGSDPTPKLAEGGFRDPHIPPAVATVLSRACAFDPSARHESARELKHDLLAALDPKFQDAGVKARAAATTPQRFKVLGIIWNVVVFLIWLIIIYCSYWGTLNPHGALAKESTPMVFLQYLTFVMIPWTILSFLLLDKRRIRPKVPALRNLTKRREILICLAVVVASFFCFLVLLIIAGSLYDI